jgi:hypothetical protein
MKTTAARQITRTGSVRLLADLLQDAEEEVTRLRALLVTHLCNCIAPAADPLNHHNHGTHCGYRKAMEELS